MKADFFIFAGDMMSDGDEPSEITDFLSWLSKMDQFQHKIVVAGNHDCYFSDNKQDTQKILQQYPKITYLQD